VSSEPYDPELPLEIRARWEIWGSFVSLLRSYAAAAGETYTVQSFSDWAKVEHQQNAVRFCFSPRTGEAVWRKVCPAWETWGHFQINDDGTFQFDDGPKHLDMSVIDWIEWLGKEHAFNIPFLDPLQSDLKSKP
jgi:hypothetical protein